MTESILLCTDLDRTLLPNGEPPESEGARQRFRQLAERPEIRLAYVSGRHQALVESAIEEFALPLPDYVIGDVGTTIYEIRGEEWRSWSAWRNEIAPDWGGLCHGDLLEALSRFDELTEQEVAKQNTFKVSYYVPEDVDHHRLLRRMHSRLAALGVRASLIWSIDDLKHVGLLDVLPERATKLHAIEFLSRHKGYGLNRTVFAGDSGNDLPVLTSRFPSVLVANAREDVRQEALEQSQANGTDGRLYLARGGFLGMNGNYSAGIMEGLAHFLPETEEWMGEELEA